MPRLRTLKPGFFANEDLAQVAPLGRLLFAGLWCLADRRGRLEDRPARIKVQLLAYDACDVDELLAELAIRGFITRYEMAGHRYIQVVNFARHQNPHSKEAESVIPPPDEHDAFLMLAPDEHEESTVLARPDFRSPSSVFRSPSSVFRSPVPDFRAPGGVGGERAADADAPRARAETASANSATRTGTEAAEVAALTEAFQALELPAPHLSGRESKSLLVLLHQFPPGDIAACWADIRQGVYGDQYAREHLSFQYLGGMQRLANWQSWRDAGKPPREATNGATGQQRAGGVRPPRGAVGGTGSVAAKSFERPLDAEQRALLGRIGRRAEHNG